MPTQSARTILTFGGDTLTTGILVTGLVLLYGAIAVQIGRAKGVGEIVELIAVQAPLVVFLLVLWVALD